MIDEDRRKEILKAEEAVRLLAQELWRVNQSQAVVEKITRSLAVAQAALEESTASNQNAVEVAASDFSRRVVAAQTALEESERANLLAVQAVEQCAKEARASLKDARAQLEAVENQVGRGIRELRAAGEPLTELPALLEKTLEQRLAGVLKGMDSMRREQEQDVEKRRQELTSIRRLTVALILLSLLSIGSSVACLVLLLYR
jgi:hypothetical protein